MNAHRIQSLTFNQRRLVVGVVLAVALLSTANHLFAWGIGAPYSKQITVACYVLLAFTGSMFLPTKAEWDEYRGRNSSDDA